MRSIKSCKYLTCICYPKIKETEIIHQFPYTTSPGRSLSPNSNTLFNYLRNSLSSNSLHKVHNYGDFLVLDPFYIHTFPRKMNFPSNPHIGCYLTFFFNPIFDIPRHLSLYAWKVSTMHKFTAFAWHPSAYISVVPRHTNGS